MKLQFEIGEKFMELKEFVGIYAISSKYDSKNYVGQTQNSKGFWKRWMQHRRLLRLNKHENPYLQKSYNKHGESQFVFRVLEICERDINLDERETYWVETLKSMKNENGWNIDRIDKYGVRSQYERPERKNLREFELISPNGEIVKAKGVTKFAKENGLIPSAVQMLLSGRYKSSMGWKSLHPDVITREELKKSFTVISPLGESFTFDNPHKFMGEHGLLKDNQTFYGMLSGKYKSCKEWSLASNPIKEYFIISPEGKHYRFLNISKFAKEHNLHNGKLGEVLNRKSVSIKGWKLP